MTSKESNFGKIKKLNFLLFTAIFVWGGILIFRFQLLKKGVFRVVFFCQRNDERHDRYSFISTFVFLFSDTITLCYSIGVPIHDLE